MGWNIPVTSIDYFAEARHHRDRESATCKPPAKRGFQWESRAAQRGRRLEGSLIVHFPAVITGKPVIWFTMRGVYPGETMFTKLTAAARQLAPFTAYNIHDVRRLIIVLADNAGAQMPKPPTSHLAELGNATSASLNLVFRSTNIRTAGKGLVSRQSATISVMAIFRLRF